MLTKWNDLNVNSKRAFVSLLAGSVLVFCTDFGLSFLAEALALYFVLIGGKDFLDYWKNKKSPWYFAQSTLAIILSLGLLYFSFKDSSSFVFYYVGTWATFLGIAYLVVGWQVCRLNQANGTQDMLVGLLLNLLAILVLSPSHMTSHSFAHLLAFFFLLNAVVVILSNWMQLRNRNR